MHTITTIVLCVVVIVVIAVIVVLQSHNFEAPFPGAGRLTSSRVCGEKDEIGPVELFAKAY